MPALILMKILQSYISSGALFAKGGFVIKKELPTAA